MTSLLTGVRDQLSRSHAPLDAASVLSAVRAWTPAAVTDPGLLTISAQVRAELIGAGPLQHLLNEPDVTDVLVNGPGDIWVDRGSGLSRSTLTFTDESAIYRLAQRLAASCGRRLDENQPFVDARLPDGTRFHAVLPPIAGRSPVLSFRRFAPRGYALTDLVSGPDAAAVVRLLEEVLARRLAFLVSGGTGSGKTTLLRTLLGQVTASQRLVVLEDLAELNVLHPHAVALESRPANAEGAGAIGLRDLVRQSLRMRPDRIVIGECRGPEVIDFLAALNTGHEGGASTLHANAPAEVIPRLEALALTGGLGRGALHAQLAASLQVILHMHRSAGVRTLDQIAVLNPQPSGHVAVVPVWRRGSSWADGLARLQTLLAARSIELTGGSHEV